MKASDPDRQFWERHAAGYDRSMVLFGRPLSRVRTLSAEGVSGALRVLEVAAGTGLITTALAPRVEHLIAIDYAEPMLQQLRRRVADAGLTNVECAAGDLHALAYPPRSFDAVVAANVLHLVPDLDAALAALQRMVRPGGTLIAPTFCHGETRVTRLLSRGLAAIGQPMHRRFSAASLRAALENAGLAVRRAETVPGMIPIGYVEATVVATAP